MPAHRTQNSRHLRVEAAPTGAPPINIISPTPQTFSFDSGAINAQASEAGSYPFASQASRSLPNLSNLFTFHASPTGEYPNYSDSQSPSGSQRSSLYTSFGESPTSTSSFFASPSHSLKGSSFASSPPDSSGTPSLSPSPPPFSYPSHTQTSAEGDRPQKSRSRSSSSPAPYPHPLPPHSNGQVRTQPPRPPNPWICFRNVRSAQYKELNYPELPRVKDGRGHSVPNSPATGTLGLDGESVRRPRQADLSKHISLEWKSLTDEEKAPYVRMSEEAKLVHAQIYPGYKYQPRRKIDGTSTGKKSSLRPEPSKKPAKSKKSGKSSKVIKKDESQCEIEIPDDLPKQLDDLSRTADNLAIVQIELTSHGIDIGTDGQESTSTGDLSKEWTWLPEQTLLPITWDPDQEHGGDLTFDAVMHPLDANIDDENENDENVFGQPFYLSLPPATHDSEDQSNVAPFFPFNAESESDAAFFAVPNLHFQASSLGLQDDHLDAFPDVSQLPDQAVEDITSPFMLRRDSISSTVNDYELPDCSNAYLPFSYESIGESLGFTTEELGVPYVEHTFPSESDVPTDPAERLASPGPPIPSGQTSPATSPRVDRQGPVVAQPSSISSDGLLCPPATSLVRPHVRSRPKNVHAPRSMSMDVSSGYQDMRSVQTANFSPSSGVMTSVLIPMPGPRYGPEMERDLEEYRSALESVASDSRADGGHSFSSFQVSQPSSKVVENRKDRTTVARGQNLEDSELDPHAEFDFDAEFGDIIDIQAPRPRSATT